MRKENMHTKAEVKEWVQTNAVIDHVHQVRPYTCVVVKVPYMGNPEAGFAVEGFSKCNPIDRWSKAARIVKAYGKALGFAIRFLRVKETAECQ
jgi:hypothetical protein